MGFYSFHLRRGLRDRALQPVRFWMITHGLLVSSFDSYAAIVILVGDKRPKRLVLQAAVLVRSLMEALGNLFAIAEDPATNVLLFEHDGYRSAFEQLAVLEKLRGDQGKWGGFAKQARNDIAKLAGVLRLTEEQAREPSNHIRWWPKTKQLFTSRTGKGGVEIAPLIGGERGVVFAELYSLWYSNLSALAHQRLMAVGQSGMSDDPDAPFDAEQVSSNVVMQTLLFLACLLAEVHIAIRDHHVSIPPNIHVPVLWERLRPLYDETNVLLSLRYSRELGIG